MSEKKELIEELQEVLKTKPKGTTAQLAHALAKLSIKVVGIDERVEELEEARGER